MPASAELNLNGDMYINDYCQTLSQPANPYLAGVNKMAYAVPIS